MSYGITPPAGTSEPQAKKKHTTAITIGGAVAVVAGIATVGLLIGNNTDDDAKAAKQPAPTATKTSAVPTLAKRMRTWSDAGGTETITTLAADLSQVADDSNPVDLAKLSDSCSTLTADIEAAQDEDPIPDPAANKRWSLALEHLGKSATACAIGAVSKDQVQFDLMASEMTIGIKHLNAVNKRLDVLGTG
ncbi:hypothetical protein ACH4L5_34555 [Streptomyces sp. NPDC017405]|uniref:hypothetical protein n=1 Tax=unclassified Streptomyces TaxID=2593676 RepID=UPI003792A700